MYVVDAERVVRDSLPVPGALKAVVVLAVTVALSLAVSAGVLRRAPILRRVF